jgi:hypothetical protein
MEKLEVYFENALGGGFGMMPSAGAMAGIQRGGLGGFRVDLEVLFSSLLFTSLLIGSRPGTNGVGMGFYHLPLEVEFPRAPDPPKGHP